MLKIYKSNIFFFVLITIIVFAIYGKSVNYDYTGLDDKTLTQKHLLKISDLKSFTKIFFTDCYYGKLTQYYRPVLSLSFALESKIFKTNLKIFHFINIIIFILSLYLMYLFAAKFKIYSSILKLIILAVAVHPVLSSVPVWLPAQNDTLLTIFLILSFINFISYIKTDKIKFCIYHFIFYSLAIFTKETALIIIILYPVIVYCLNLKITKKQFVKNIIFCFSLITIYLTLRHFAVRSVDLSLFFNNMPFYIKTIFTGTLKHLYFLFITDNIPIMLYDIKISPADIIPVIIFILLVFACIKNLLDKKIFLLGCSFVFLPIFMTFLQEDYAFYSHRFILSMTGIVIIFGCLLSKIAKIKPILKKYFIVFLLFTLPPFSYLSYLYADRYKNTDTFWANAYISAPNYHLVYNGLYNLSMDKKEYQKALFFIEKAEELHNKTDYLINLTTVNFILSKDFETAEKNYMEIINKTNYRSDFCFYQLSKLSYLKNDLDKAIEYAEKSIQINPYNPEVLTYLANYYALNKNFDKAENIYKQLLKSDKTNEYYNYLLKNLEDDRKGFV